MGKLTVDRMESKNPYQGLFNELKEDYGLSPIEAKALVRQVVALGEPADKRIKDCKLISVNFTMSFNGENRIEHEKGLAYIRKIKIHQLAWEAYAQGGLLSYEDIDSILGISISTIKRNIRQYKAEGIIVSTRGQIEDIDPKVNGFNLRKGLSQNRK